MDAARSSTDITSAFSDLHQRTGPAPRKRTRFAPAKATRQSASDETLKGQSSQPLSRPSNPSPSSPASSAPLAVVPPPKPPPNGIHSPSNSKGRPSPPNGVSRAQSSSPIANRLNSVRGIFETIADTQRAAAALPRPDRRFLCGKRPLDTMPQFLSSIAISLFHNGYVRHDAVLAHAAEEAAAPTVDVIGMPRLPYDSASRLFLTALEFGVLPLEEDLPPESDRKYYDGCLIAEIFDYRGVDQSFFLHPSDSWRKHGTFLRVLLRPDACNHVADVDALAEDLDDDAALNVEAKLLLVQHPQLDLDARDSLIEPGPSLWRPLTRKKRRRGPRPTGCAEPPPLSMAALMLIAASDKEQVNCQLRMRHSRVADHASSSVPVSPKTTASRPATSGSAVATTMAPQEVRKLIFSTKPSRAPGQVELLKAHRRLRTIRLILPDKATLAHFRQAKAAAIANGENSERVKQNMFHNVSKQGRQVCIMELVSRPGRGCDVALFRGNFGDRARDVNKMSLGSIADANMFMDHFKSIMEKEGYVCIHDGDPQSGSALSAQHQQQMDVRRRLLSQQQAAAAAGNLSPVSSHATQTMKQRAQAQAQKRQLQLLQQKQALTTLGKANVLQQERQMLQQQHLEQQHQRPAAYPQNIAHLQQQAAQQRTATAANKTAAQNALNVQAAMSAALASNNPRASSQQLASLQRNRSPAGRPISMGASLTIPANQVPLPGRGARPGDGSASPGSQLMSEMQQIQMQQDEIERNRMLEGHRKHIYGQTRDRYRRQLDPASMALMQQQQAVAASNMALAASNAIPASALVTPPSQGISPGLQHTIPPSLLQNMEALSHSSLQQQLKQQQQRDNSDAGSVDTAANSHSAKR